MVTSADLVAPGSSVFTVYDLREDTGSQGDHAVYFRRSSDGGATFAPAQRILSLALQEYVTSVHLSYDSCGTLTAWVEHQSAGLYLFVSRDGGQTFEPQIHVPVFDRSQQFLGAVLRHPPCGRLVAEVINQPGTNPPKPALLSGSGSPLTFALTDIPSVTSGVMWDSSLEQDGTGNLWHLQVLLVGANTVIHIYHSTDGGQTFQFMNDEIGPTLGYTPHLHLRPFLESADVHTVFVGWLDLKGAQQDQPRWMVARSTDGGSHFTTVLPATAEPEPGVGGSSASAALDTSGRIWISYPWCSPIPPGIWDGWSCETRLRNSDAGFTGFAAPMRENDILAYKTAPYKVREAVSNPLVEFDGTSNTLYLLWVDTRYRITPSLASTYDAFFTHLSLTSGP